MSSDDYESVQMRTYEIADGELDEFIEGWTTHVVPLREAMGFVVCGAWCDAERSTFTWVLGYHGQGSQAEAEKAYQERKARGAANNDPSRYVTSASLRDMQRIH